VTPPFQQSQGVESAQNQSVRQAAQLAQFGAFSVRETARTVLAQKLLMPAPLRLWQGFSGNRPDGFITGVLQGGQFFPHVDGRIFDRWRQISLNGLEYDCLKGLVCRLRDLFKAAMDFFGQL
jgi:hypothetical protein